MTGRCVGTLCTVGDKVSGLRVQMLNLVNTVGLVLEVLVQLLVILVLLQDVLVLPKHCNFANTILADQTLNYYIPDFLFFIQKIGEF